MKVTKHEPHKGQLSKAIQVTLCIPIIPPSSVLYVSQPLLQLSSLCQLTLQSLFSYLLYSLAKMLFAQSFISPVHI